MNHQFQKILNRLFKSLIVYVILSFLFIGPLLSEQQNTPQTAPSAGNLIVTFLDCGQGDAIVIKTPKGKIYLIDTGPNDKSYGGKFDAGNDVIIPFLESRKVKVINGMIISHPHLDHYGGTLSIFDKYRVLEYEDSGWATKSPVHLNILKKIDAEKIIYRAVKEGDILQWEDPLAIEIFGPRSESYSTDPAKENPNNRSIILKLTYKKISFLFSGDAEAESEDYVIKKYGNRLEAHILKAPHHASKTSSTEEFLKTIKPEVVIISCGRKNRFRHPYPATLERFNELGIKYYRTDTEGTIQVITDGTRYSIKTFGVGQTPGKTP